MKTADGKEILSAEFIDKLRETESAKRTSKCFIAQKGAQEKDLHTNVNILVTGGNRGGGKANTKSTKIVTPNGYKRMGDLNVGDKICTPYNGVQTVLSMHDFDKSTVYVFYFDDGTSVSVMDNHRFLARKGNVGKFEVMTARQIIDCYRLNMPFPDSLRKNQDEYIELPLCGEVDFGNKWDEMTLPIHPYLLGVASGKGKMHFSQYGLMLTRSKFDFSCAYNFGYFTKLNRSNGYYYLRGFTNEDRRRITQHRKEIDSFIPDEYKYASVQARYQYLNGVFRVNGRARNKHPYYESINKRYVQELADMLRSIGGWVRVAQVTDVPEKIGWYCLYAVMPDDRELHSNALYKMRATYNAPVPKSPENTLMLTKKIIRINKADDKVNCRCIEVSGRDHLYMTEHYTVNHNTITMLTKPLYRIDNKHFNGIILRKNKDDFENIVNESTRWFAPLGKYNKSKDDMTWNFNSGAKLKLTTYDMPYADFDVKYRGQQFAYIGIDELPQMPFEFFKFLMTCSRNTIGVRSQILGTCNPDPLSWLRRFLDWWIGKEDTVYSDGKLHPERKGFIIPERDGVIRYCYMPDDNVENIIWGDTPDEVYEQCRDIIDNAWDDSLEEFGYNKKTFAIKSVTFIKASLYDNKALLKNDPSYIANLLNQPPEIRMKEFDGNWDVVKMGEDMIQAYHMDTCFSNATMTGDGIRRACTDVAGTGGDNCVTWLKVGNHFQDVFVCRRDPYTTANIIEQKLIEWGVTEEYYTYDLNGMGQVLKGKFPRAIPFNNQEAVPVKYKSMYGNLKSMAAYLFAQKTIHGEWSIEHSLLDRKFMVHKTTMKLYNILQAERKAIKQDMSKADKGWYLIHKEQMKNISLVGWSPDFIEAQLMFEVFEIKKTSISMPSWLSGERPHGNGGRIVRRIGFSKPKITANG